MSSSLPPFLAAWTAAAARAGADLSPAVLDASRRSWFDTVAVTAAGAVENCTRAALRACGSGPAEALSPAEAALVLGTASHALDYDDVCMLATCHPSAPLVAALLALVPVLERERPKLSLGELLAAYALGTETILRLGEWLGFRHYALGFHATATLGAVGVAASCAHALRLPEAQARAALAIAASNAGGLRANFGTDTKPLHVGFAAHAGLRAALLAQAGANASDDVWGPAGFAHAFNGGQTPEPLHWDPLGPWALEQPGFEHKRFPSCYMTHRLIAGVQKLRARHPDAAGMPVSLEIEVARHGTSALKYPLPSTGLQAKFSGPYCAAAAWCDESVGLGAFTDDAVRRPQLQAQSRQVVLRERDLADETLDSAPVHVTVRGAGWTDEIVVDWAPGSLADQITRDQMRGKWRDCATHAGFATDDADALVLLDAPLDTPVTALLRPLLGRLLGAVPR